jgi:hypothetical protein
MSVPRSRRDDPLDVVRQIIEIGARHATSLGEAQTAAFTDGWLRRVGMSVSADTFRAATSLGLTYPLLSVLGIAATLLPLWMSSPLPALLIAVFGLMFSASDALSAPLPAIARYRDSQNIVAVRASSGAEDPASPPPRWRVVLLAPLDAPADSTGPYGLMGRQMTALLGRVVAFALLVTLLLLLLLLPRDIWRYGLVLPGAYFVLALLPARWRARPEPHLGSAGALAVLLTAVERLGTVRSIELWAVSLGSTATGNDGLHNLLARYPFAPENTLFVVLQHISTGPIVRASHEGLLRQFRADPYLAEVAAQVDINNAQIQSREGPYRTASSIGSLLHSRNYRTLTLFTRDSFRQRSTDDILAQGSRETLERAIQLVLGMVRCLDSGDQPCTNGSLPPYERRGDNERRRGRDRRAGDRREHQQDKQDKTAPNRRER